MRTQLLAATIIATALAGSAQAQNSGPYRRFTDWPTDTNRNDRIVYAPLGWAFTGSRPVGQPHDVSSATWYQVRPGSAAVKPDSVLDKAEYRLERFDMANGVFNVVITRRGGQADPAPELRLVDTETNITSRAQPSIEGDRYTFVVKPPLAGFGASATPKAERFEIRFMGSGNVRPPASIVRAPTFGGEDLETRSLSGPPQLPKSERVAGKRIEYRSATGPRVVEDSERVAGKRQEMRRK